MFLGIGKGIEMEARELSKKELVSELRLRVAEIESLKSRLQKEQDDVQAGKDIQSTLLDNTIVAVGLSDGNKVLCANRLLLELFGYSDLDEFLSIPLIDSVAPSSRAEILERMEQTAKGIPYDPYLVFNIRRKDGSERTVEINVVPYRWEGRPCRLSLFRDITERRRVEEAFRESETKYKALVETTDTGYVILDPEGKVLDANPEYVRLTGHGELLEILGRKVVEWTAPHDIVRNAEEVRKCLEQGFVRNLELDYVNAEGRFTPIEINATTLQTAEGRRIVTLCRDISERKRAMEALKHAEQALRKSTEYLDRIINCIGDPIFVKDHQHAFVLVNDAFCLLAGKQRQDLLGKKIGELLPKKEADLISEHEELVFQTGKESIIEEEFVDAKGETRTNMTRTTILKDEAGKEQIVGVIRDITEHRRLEAQFMQSQKMEAIGVLAGGVAHDFNNLLSVINGYSDLLLSDLGPDYAGIKELEQIKQAGKHAASLTSQLLAFSRRQVFQPSVIDLNAVVSGTCKILRRIIGESIDLAVLAQPDLWFVEADPGQIEQVIMNLAVNARDAMPKGGRLTIETVNVLLDEVLIRELPGMSAGPHVMLVVGDSGTGIDRETQAHIFEPFFTTKELGKGTGLGLSTVYGIIRQSNGFIGVSSEVGKGTTFKIYLPRALSESKYSGGAVKDGIDLSGTETVLLVEDEGAVRGLAARILNDRSYRVIEAANGKEALRIAHQFAGEIHLILTDVVMPEMGGPELVARIRKVRPAAKALFVSGYASEDIVQHGLLDSHSALLLKPFTPASLARKVREVIDSGAV
jgi:two-component system, cell cycle sensor histidine kinase and response regulator CckA